jgi:hypothetical protein
MQIGISPDTVTDPQCGLVLPLLTGLDTRFGPEGSVHRFCSTACALAWEQRRRGPRPALSS